MISTFTSVFFEPGAALLFSVFFGLSFAAFFAMFHFWERRRLRERILRELQREFGDQADHLPHGRQSLWRELFPDIFEGFGAAFGRLEKWSEGKLSDQRFRFEQAGIAPRYGLLYLLSANGLAVVMLGLVYLILLKPLLVHNPHRTVLDYAYLGLVIYFALRFFDLLLDGLIRWRQGKIAEAMPYALDLMLVCVRSGMGTQTTFLTIARELKADFPILAHEFERTARELDLVPDVRLTLGHLAQRSTLPVVRQMCMAFIQSHEQGTSLSQSISRLSREYVRERLLSLEAKAGKISALSIVPMIFVLLPCTLVIIFAPPLNSLATVKKESADSLKQSGQFSSDIRGQRSSDEEASDGAPTDQEVSLDPGARL
ncbi:MAG: type II secretion system F family protein [Holosporales bacterium]